jgi:hypothetical protein
MVDPPSSKTTARQVGCRLKVKAARIPLIPSFSPKGAKVSTFNSRGSGELGNFTFFCYSEGCSLEKKLVADGEELMEGKG